MHDILVYIALFVLLVVLAVSCYRKTSPAAPAPVPVPAIPRLLPWEAIHADIEQGQYGILHSVIVQQGGHTIFEKYYNGWQPHQIHDLQSSTKSVVSLLIGIAIDKGYIKSVEEKLSQLLPDSLLARTDSVKKNIRLRQLLTMSAGFEWTEQSVKYRQKGNTLTDMYAGGDGWLDFILGRTIVAKPGTQFNYNSGISILLGAVLQHAIGTSITSFAEQHLFEPMGITHYQWSQYQGIAHCGGGLYLSPADMVKIGQLCLDGGRWNNRQLVSEKWIRESMRPRFRVSDDASYGYHWWISGRLFDLEPMPYAAGDGWQFIYVSKFFDLAVAVTGRNYSFEAPRTTMTQNELLFSILCTQTPFAQWLQQTAARQPDYKKLSFYELFFLSYSFNRAGYFDHTIALLEPAAAAFKKEFRFNYLLGEAYCKAGDTAKGRKYLENCISSCEEKSYPEAGYCAMARELIR